MIIKVIVVLVLIGSLLMVAPGFFGVMGSTVPINATLNPSLAVSQTTIGGIFSSGLSVAGVALFGIAVFLISGIILLKVDFFLYMKFEAFIIEQRTVTNFPSLNFELFPN